MGSHPPTTTAQGCRGGRWERTGRTAPERVPARRDLVENWLPSLPASGLARRLPPPADTPTTASLMGYPGVVKPATT